LDRQFAQAGKRASRSPVTAVCTSIASIAPERSVKAQAWTAIIALGLFAGGTARAVECKVQTFEAVQFTICRVALRRESLQLYWRDEAGKPYGRLLHLRDSLASQRKTLAFGMNAGMYEEDLSPLGLFVVNGRELTPLNRRSGRMSGGIWDRCLGSYAEEV
jgi:uncharacterized protein YigE (DUF2233 family)